LASVTTRSSLSCTSASSASTARRSCVCVCVRVCACVCVFRVGGWVRAWGCGGDSEGGRGVLRARGQCAGLAQVAAVQVPTAAAARGMHRCPPPARGPHHTAAHNTRSAPVAA
jgi:hypothetical protein